MATRSHVTVAFLLVQEEVFASERRGEKRKVCVPSRQPMTFCPSRAPLPANPPAVTNTLVRCAARVRGHMRRLMFLLGVLRIYFFTRPEKRSSFLHRVNSSSRPQSCLPSGCTYKYPSNNRCCDRMHALPVDMGMGDRCCRGRRCCCARWYMWAYMCSAEATQQVNTHLIVLACVHLYLSLSRSNSSVLICSCEVLRLIVNTPGELRCREGGQRVRKCTCKARRC